MIRKFPLITSHAWKSTKKQQWNTVAKKSGSGKVRTMTTWRKPTWTIQASFTHLSTNEYKTLMGFLALIKGGHETFLWKDPEDYREVGITLGTGAQGKWQAIRKWGDYIEPVKHVENLVLYANGRRVVATVDDKGIITTSDRRVQPSDPITADYEYFWEVRIPSDSLEMEYVFTDFYRTKSIKMETV